MLHSETKISLFCLLLFAFICCTTRCHSLSFVITRCITRWCLFHHPLLFVVIRCQSLSFVVTRCYSLYHSLSLVVIRCTTCCHSLSLVVPLLVIRCHSLSHRCQSMYTVFLKKDRVITTFSFEKRIIFTLVQNSFKIKDIINPNNCLLKTDNFSVKSTSD